MQTAAQMKRFSAIAIVREGLREASPWMWRSLRASEAPELADFSVVCSAKPPYAVTSASADWLQLCGFVEHEVIGKTLALIQGPASNQSDLRTMGWLAYVRGGGA